MPIEVYTASQVAELLGCATTTVEEMARAGQLPGVKPGGAWVFPAGALAAGLDELARRQAAERAQRQAPAAVSRPLDQPPQRGARRKPLPVLPALPPG